VGSVDPRAIVNPAIPAPHPRYRYRERFRIATVFPRAYQSIWPRLTLRGRDHAESANGGSILAAARAESRLSTS